MAKRGEKNVLFLCTGNYYRSRFAEVLFNSLAGKMGLPWKAASKGLALERGVNNVGPMAVSAVKTLEVMGVRAADALARFPMQVTVDDFSLADWVVALKQAEHLPLLRRGGGRGGRRILGLEGGYQASRVEGMRSLKRKMPETRTSRKHESTKARKRGRNALVRRLLILPCAPT